MLYRRKGPRQVNERYIIRIQAKRSDASCLRFGSVRFGYLHWNAKQGVRTCVGHLKFLFLLFAAVSFLPRTSKGATMLLLLLLLAERGISVTRIEKPSR